MKRDTLSDAVGLISDSYIEEAAAFEPKRSRKNYFVWGALAACLAAAVAVGAVFALRSGKVEKDSSPDAGASSGIFPRPYGDRLTTQESALVWPWEYRTDGEKYTTATIGGKAFITRSDLPLKDESVIGESLGLCTAGAYDIYTDKTCTETFEAYAVKNTDSGHIAAVKLPDGYHIYCADVYDPPKDLGGLADIYGLSGRLCLGEYHEFEGYDNKGRFTLSEGTELGKMLCELRDAVFIPGDTLSREGKKLLAFTVNCPELGIDNHVLDITEDGLVMTNIFEYAYTFDIGRENAAKLISFAKERSVRSDAEQKNNLIGGRITEIGEGYIKLDDSELCKDPEQGMVFIIPTDDLRIKRCLEYPGKLKEGDTVAVSIKGEVEPQTGKVSGAYDLRPAFIGSEGLYVAE